MRNSAWVRTAAIAAGALLVITLGSAAAQAAAGPVAPTSITAVARLEFGPPGRDDSRTCTAVLVRPRALATSTDCVASAAHPSPDGQGSTTLPIVAEFRSGLRLPIAEVLPGTAPGVSIAVLYRPADVAPIPLSTSPATAGESLLAVGFGRTATEWIPGQPHAVSFTVQQAGADTLDLALADSAAAGLCRGDAGAPILRDLGGDRYEVVALAATAQPKGCLGEPAPAATGAVVARSAAGLAQLPAATSNPYDQRTFGPGETGQVTAQAEFGWASATGDFNKDGFPDLAVGAPYDGSGAGSVTVYAGSASGPAAGRKLQQTGILDGNEAGDRFGAALSVGDFNKDGYADLAVGVPGEVVSSIKTGAVALFNGSASGLGAGRGITLSGLGRANLAGSEFGAAFAVADFNVDGYVDLAVGAPGRAVANVAAGEVTVLKGSAGGPVLGWIVAQAAAGASNAAGDRFGAALAAGNVLGPKTGTVYPDLIVGSPGEGTNGATYVIPGSASGPVTGGFGYFPGLITQADPDHGYAFGGGLAVADFDKDGWADIAIGLPGRTICVQQADKICTGVGGVVLKRGASAAPTTRPVIREVLLSGSGAGNALAVGDLNGDGYQDLVETAHSNAHSVITHLGGPRVSDDSLTVGPIIKPPAFLAAAETGDEFGSSLATADFTKDGKADVVVGAFGEWAPGGAGAGVVTTLIRVAQGS